MKLKKLTPTQEKQLLLAAADMLKNSYSPYSKFPVAAAVLCKNGNIYGGTNIENASFGATICAERSAIFSAVAHGERDFAALAIVFPQKGLGKLGTPCGLCRQVMAEFFAPEIPIITADVSSGKPQGITRRKLKDFYPYPFSPEALKKSSKK